jgi:hypothetical protein
MKKPQMSSTSIDPTDASRASAALIDFGGNIRPEGAELITEAQATPTTKDTAPLVRETKSSSRTDDACGESIDHDWGRRSKVKAEAVKIERLGSIASLATGTTVLPEPGLQGRP